MRGQLEVRGSWPWMVVCPWFPISITDTCSQLLFINSTNPQKPSPNAHLFQNAPPKDDRNFKRSAALQPTLTAFPDPSLTTLQSAAAWLPPPPSCTHSSTADPRAERHLPTFSHGTPFWLPRREQSKWKECGNHIRDETCHDCWATSGMGAEKKD